ncbi:hypothetical protein LOCC1_G008085 [Lachnellula occidentalis]|uniref:Uncharacterized protein n=1 Tax=Lachnellula occidentalis TaxID=215460 RepID=A0A8H8RGP7_9HELO|nr:hypothetical protein LOCC1_G008085 [Lachnellula occidentalis]
MRNLIRSNQRPFNNTRLQSFHSEQLFKMLLGRRTKSSVSQWLTTHLPEARTRVELGKHPAPNNEHRYPKHVWSPSGGWYTQPSNWKANTAIIGAVMFGITAMMWKVSADKEYRDKFPEKGRFFPSR